MKRFLVIGLGRFGMSLAETLYTGGEEVIAVDADMDRIEQMKDRVSHVVQLDSTDPDALKSIGADQVDTAVVAIGENFEASVVTTAILKELGIEEIIVRAYTEREKKILQLIGATRVLFVEDEMGRRTGKAISGSRIIDYIELCPTHSIVQWQAPEGLTGKPLSELNLSEKEGLTLLAVRKRDDLSGEKTLWKREKDRLELNPSPEYRLERGDVLIFIGKHQDLMRFTGKWPSPS